MVRARARKLLSGTPQPSLVDDIVGRVRSSWKSGKVGLPGLWFCAPVQERDLSAPPVFPASAVRPIGRGQIRQRMQPRKLGCAHTDTCWWSNSADD